MFEGLFTRNINDTFIMPFKMDLMQSYVAVYT